MRRRLPPIDELLIRLMFVTCAGAATSFFVAIAVILWLAILERC